MFKLFAYSLEKNECAVRASIQVVAASIALALTSQLAIPLPFTPVPITLQTLAIYLIALTLGPKKGTAAVLLYLAQGSIGLPVFAGGMINPFWFLGPRAGYLIGFVVATWMIGTLANVKKERSYFETALILGLGEVVILSLGALWLAFFIGFPNAVGMGVLPFLIGDFIKIAVVTLSFRPLMSFLHKIFEEPAS